MIHSVSKITGRKIGRPDSAVGHVDARAAWQLERLTALFGRYASTGLACDAPALVRAAHQVRVVQAELAWQELFRASARHRRMTPMSGLVGSVVVEGGLAPFLPWLVWGTLTHVGKDAAMGNGMLQLEPA